MNIINPGHSGFCYGVKRSVDTAYQSAPGTYLYGEIVHNPQVVRALEEKGLQLIHSLDEIPPANKPGANILIRAHGVPEAVLTEIAAQGMTAIDKTCPVVKKIHAIVAKTSAQGMDVIVCGTPGHPEVVGIVSRVSTQAIVVKDATEAHEIIPRHTFAPAGVCLVGQTTLLQQTFEALLDYLTQECPNIPILTPHNTLCSATTQRQAELRTLAAKADACIIVGGKNSANVAKLYEIARALCPHTVLIENAEAFNAPAFLREVSDARDGRAENIVIAGGASTPAEEVQKIELILRP